MKSVVIEWKVLCNIYNSIVNQLVEAIFPLLLFCRAAKRLEICLSLEYGGTNLNDSQREINKCWRPILRLVLVVWPAFGQFAASVYLLPNNHSHAPFDAAIYYSLYFFLLLFTRTHQIYWKLLLCKITYHSFLIINRKLPKSM